MKIKTFKPMLADKADLSKISYPVMVSPKLDGIRCVIKDGRPVARSLKPIPNRFVQSVLSHPSLDGMDGELCVGSINSPNLMQATSSGVMSFEGEPEFTFQVFDLIDEYVTADVPFQERHECLCDRVDFAQSDFPFIQVVPHYFVENEEELLELENQFLEEGFEGLMIRSLDGPYKYGRSTAREGYLLKLKRFEDSEIRITGFEEQMHNDNPATKNELGHTERSSSKENLVPAGVMGKMIGVDMTTGQEVVVGTGFTATQREEIWNHQDDYLGRIAKYKHFSNAGVLNARRFAVFIGFRDILDM